jgi:hypothetical protein
MFFLNQWSGVNTKFFQEKIHSPHDNKSFRTLHFLILFSIQYIKNHDNVHDDGKAIVVGNIFTLCII